jgi:hypothetical protein
MTLKINEIAWDRHKQCGGAKSINGIQPSPIDNLIFNDNKPAQIRVHSKRSYTITKMNDNINMDSTIAGSMSAHS